MCLCLSACSGQEVPQQTSSAPIGQEQSRIETDDARASDHMQSDTAKDDAVVFFGSGGRIYGTKIKADRRNTAN